MATNYYSISDGTKRQTVSAEDVPSAVVKAGYSVNTMLVVIPLCWSCQSAQDLLTREQICRHCWAQEHD